MMENMAQVHMTEAELARDLHAVLEQERQGAEIVVDPPSSSHRNRSGALSPISFGWQSNVRRSGATL